MNYYESDLQDLGSLRGRVDLYVLLVGLAGFKVSVEKPSYKRLCSFI